MSTSHTCDAESPTTSSCVSKSTRHPTVAVRCVNSANIPPYHNLPSVNMSAYGQSGSSAISAAAAAALLLQAAANNGSLNGDKTPSNSSLGARRSSATSLFESPQVSPFSSAMISAAVQQAAALAAAQAAISSSNSSSGNKLPSDLQAAVTSLASASQTRTLLQEPCELAAHPSQAVTEFLLLSEKHPEFLSSHPSLASVIQRRSSDILSKYVPDTRLDNEELMTDSKSATASSAHAANTHVQEDNFSYDPSSIMEAKQLEFSDQPHGEKIQFDQDTDPYQFTQVSSIGTDDFITTTQRFQSFTNTPNFGPHLGLLGSVYSADRSFSRADKISPSSDSSANRILVPHSYTHGQCLSPHPLFAATAAEALPTLCPSSSPLSCSSLSNSTTPKTNISPLLTDYRNTSNSTDVGSDLTTKTNVHGSFHRGGCMNEQEVKPKFSGMCAEEPGRKREQRLIKNREAARECRRKKKEYVKCLEARVNLLESQNQQLIDELHKVRALCFKDFLGLGLNSSTVACAAAVLAATSSGTYTIPSVSTTTSVKSPDSIISAHLNEQLVYNPPDPSSVDELSSHLYRTRQQSVLSNSRPSGSDATRSNEQHVSTHCLSDYPERVDPRDILPGESLSHAGQVQTILNEASRMRSSPSYESLSPSEAHRLDQMVKSRLFGHLTRHDAHDSTSSEFFVHPPYSAKRSYHKSMSGADDDRNFSQQCSEMSSEAAVSQPKHLKSTIYPKDSSSLLTGPTTIVTESEQTASRSQLSA